MPDRPENTPSVMWIGPGKDIELLPEGTIARHVPDFETAMPEVDRERFDVIIVDLTAARNDEIHLLLRSRQRPVDAEVIGLLSRDEEMLGEAIRSGINDFLLAPVRPDEFMARLRMALARLRSTRSYRRASGYLTTNSLTMHLPTDRQLIIPVADMLTRDLHPRGQATEEQAFHIRLTLSEVLTNAMEHGSLEISLEEKIVALEDGTFEELFAQRMARPDLAGRVVSVSMDLSPSEVRYIIGDEGPGFNVEKVMDRLSEPRPELPCGRGLYLIKHFMDGFRYSRGGRRVELIKQLTPVNVQS